MTPEIKEALPRTILISVYNIIDQVCKFEYRNWDEQVMFCYGSPIIITYFIIMSHV